MPNYENGTIYKICCKDPEIKDCYVGSTTDHNSRKSAHKSNCNNENVKHYNYPVYRYIRDTGGWENWDFVLLEDYPCRTKKQLNIRERYWFEKLGAKLNDKYPERNAKEWHQDNKEHMKEYRKENKEKIAKRMKEWEEKNKDKRKEKKGESDKKRYEKNKEKISENNKVKVECPCGSIVRKSDLSKHKKTQKHQNWEKTQVE
jgi:hypothetical protein